VKGASKHECPLSIIIIIGYRTVTRERDQERQMLTEIKDQALAEVERSEWNTF